MCGCGSLGEENGINDGSGWQAMGGRLNPFLPWFPCLEPWEEWLSAGVKVSRTWTPSKGCLELGDAGERMEASSFTGRHAGSGRMGWHPTNWPVASSGCTKGHGEVKTAGVGDGWGDPSAF